MTRESQNQSVTGQWRESLVEYEHHPVWTEH